MWTFNTVLRNVNTTSTQFPFKHGRVYTTKPLETTLSFRMRIYKTLAEQSTCSRSHSLPTITITLLVWVFNAKQTRWDHSFHKWLSFYYASSISLFSSCSQDNLTMERNYTFMTLHSLQSTLYLRLHWSITTFWNLLGSSNIFFSLFFAPTGYWTLGQRMKQSEELSCPADEEMGWDLKAAQRQVRW